MLAAIPFCLILGQSQNMYKHSIAGENAEFMLPGISPCTEGWAEGGLP